MSFGNKIKDLRTKVGMTQKELAEKLHVSFQTVSRWEKDENEPDISTLKSISKWLYNFLCLPITYEDSNCFISSSLFCVFIHFDLSPFTEYKKIFKYYFDLHFHDDC